LPHIRKTLLFPYTTLFRSKENESLSDLTLLGNQDVTYTFDYDPKLLEAVDNDYSHRDYFIKFNCPEFTTLCPMTGQPDFATIYIDRKSTRLNSSHVSISYA